MNRDPANGTANATGNGTATPESGARAAAFFDLDRTLIAGSSAFVFARAARRAGYLPLADFLRSSARAIRFRLSGASDATTDAVRDQMLGAVAGLAQHDLISLNETVLPELLGMIRPEAHGLLERHHAAGRSTYIVSASPVEIVEPLARALDMTAGIGTVGEVVDGIYTGRLDGPFCYGHGKAEAIRAIAASRAIDLERSYSYSDSASDIPMMEIVGHPVAVNPDGRLARTARERGWPVVIFSQRTKTVVRRTTTMVAMFGMTVVGYLFGSRRTRA